MEGEVTLSDDCPSAEIEASFKPSPLTAAHKSLSNEIEYQGGPSTSHLRHCQAPDSRQKFFVLHQTKWDLLLISITTSLFAVTAWFAQATFSVSSMTDMKSSLITTLNVNVSSTLTILRLLEGVLSICTHIVLSKTLEMLQWALSSRENGVRSFCLLGLSPTSGILGTMGLAFSRHAGWTDRLVATTKVGLLTAIWISGLVLFVRTKLEVVYQSVISYNVTAGVGQFDGSYIPEYLQQFQDINSGYGFAVLPYSTIVTASNLVVNPMYSTAIDPVVCEDDRTCHGYLISGGLIMTTPWPPTDHASYPVVSIQNAPSTQIDFVRGIHDDAFDDAEDCTAFGNEGFLIGIKFCLARSQSAVGSLFAGLFVCTQGVQGNECWTDTKPPEVTTTFSVYRCHASITTARSNFSILSVDEVDAPVQDTDLDVEALKEAFAWLFNFSAAGIPAPASIAQYFWTVQDQLESPYWSIEPYQIFQSILAFPFWQFNPNNFGNVQLDAQNIVAGLQPDFYTTAFIGEPYDKIVVDRPMFILFCVLQAVVQSFAWVVLIWLWASSPDLVQTSSYPLIDFVLKAHVVSESQSAAHPQAGSDLDSGSATVNGDRPIKQLLKDRRIKISRINPEAKLRATN